MAEGTVHDIKEITKAKGVLLSYPLENDEKGNPVEGKYGLKGIPSSEVNVRKCILLIEAVHMMASVNGYYLEE